MLELENAGWCYSAEVIRMSGLRVLFFGIVVMVAHAGFAQTDARGLEQELKGKQLALRSYSGGPVGRYEWLGDKAVPVQGHAFTLGLFKTGSVSLKGDKLVLTGERYTLVRDSKKNDRQFAMGGEPMRLEINLHGASPTTVLPKVKEMLFADDIQALITGLSPVVAKMTPIDLSNLHGAITCKCVQLFKDGSWVEVTLPDSLYGIPVVKLQAEPEFSDLARQQNKTGTVRLAAFVDDTGRIGDVWILEPLGSGLDENAIAAVRKYVFAPASYEGKPVGIELRIEIAFERY